MTADVILREVNDADLPIFFEQQLDPTTNYMAAFTAKDPTDREAFAAHWTKIRSSEKITIRTILFDGHVAGNVASSERFGEPEITYWIGKECWGKGIATRALAQFLDEIKPRLINARAAKDNIASIRVLEKCGFTLSAQERGFANARGEEIEEVIMVLNQPPAP